MTTAKRSWPIASYLSNVEMNYEFQVEMILCNIRLLVAAASPVSYCEFNRERYR